MSVFETLRKLSSFRRCRDETISRKELGKILESARWTPSPGNVQGLEFIVVESEELESLAEEVGDDRIEDSSAAVLLVSDVERLRKRFGDNAEEFSASEAGASVQNMRLVAEELGLSSLWLTGVENSVGAIFGVPDGRKVSGVVAFGYADESVPLDPKFGLQKIVYYERYGNKVSSFLDTGDWQGFDSKLGDFERKTERILDKFRRKVREIL